MVPRVYLNNEQQVHPQALGRNQHFLLSTISTAQAKTSYRASDIAKSVASSKQTVQLKDGKSLPKKAAEVSARAS